MAAPRWRCAVAGGTIGRDFLPYLDEGSIWLQVQMPPGITLDKARDMADELRAPRWSSPRCPRRRRLGRNDDGTDPGRPRTSRRGDAASL
jgi:cobalt-zinc-cadmium resistance protein CzcA